MKGDFTRFTFNKENHYRDVRMQQGRVQLDADWNEQLDIAGHRVETGTFDIVGSCGAPMHHGGFHVVTQVGELTTEEKTREENQNPAPLETKGDLYLSAGRYYVDGILCENERIIAYTKQPDLPEVKPVTQKGTYLAYLDVWFRHLTALEAQHIREVALGGPDTTTRIKTLWQMKLLRVGDAGMNADCLKKLSAWDKEIKPGDGKMAAQAEKSVQSADPCILAPDAGYRRLENQLYRVEVHNGGARGKATFKWSRDNGSVVARWEAQDVNKNKLTVSRTGRDQKLSFASGQWIELTDDTRELLGKPGILVQLEKVDGQILTIDSNTIIDPDNPAATSVDKEEFSNDPKIRRWDSDGLIKPTNSSWIDLEDGVQVQFSTGDYKTGDYWTIPARTATRPGETGVQWRLDDNTQKPELQLSHGIHHHYCRLGLLEFDGKKWIKVHDCRNIFPPLTELTSLLYVSGDGQEAMPGHKLDGALQVRVVNGQHPVIGAKVAFTVQSGGGTLSINAPVESSADGMATCQWTLGMKGKQQVKGVLLDDSAQPVSGQVVYFNADLSVASEVAYDAAQCKFLGTGKPAGNVQDAIDRLCPIITMTMLSGDGQEACVGKELPQKLRVGVFWGNMPLEGLEVKFSVESKNATVKPSPAKVDKNGTAECTVIADSLNKDKIIKIIATLIKPPLAPKPPELVFMAKFKEASCVYVDKAICPDIAPEEEKHTVAEILKQLCQQQAEESGIKIEEILRSSRNKPVPLTMDDIFPVADFTQGLYIVCDRPIDPVAVNGRAVGSVSLELPYPLNEGDRKVWGLAEVIGFEPIVIAGEFGVVPDPKKNRENHAIGWRPIKAAASWLNERVFPRLVENKMPMEKLLVRLSLNGNLIWGQKDPRFYLDADLFATPVKKGPIIPRYPSGDGCRGGVLNIRFYISK